MSDTKDLSKILTDIDAEDALIDDHESIEDVYKDDMEDRDVPDDLDEDIDDPEDDDAWERRWGN